MRYIHSGRHNVVGHNPDRSLADSRIPDMNSGRSNYDSRSHAVDFLCFDYKLVKLHKVEHNCYWALEVEESSPSELPSTEEELDLQLEEEVG